MAEGVLNARKLDGEILAQGYPGKERKVRDCVHARRPDKEPMDSVRFETAPGEQGQVDWGSFGFITHQGCTYRLDAFVMTLGWSRASSLRFTIAADSTWFIRCHLHAFAYLGGVPKRLLYDNLKSVVLRRDAEDVVQWNPRFLDFADVAGFAPQACKPYRPPTKGKVENGVLCRQMLIPIQQMPRAFVEAAGSYNAALDLIHTALRAESEGERYTGMLYRMTLAFALRV